MLGNLSPRKALLIATNGVEVNRRLDSEEVSGKLVNSSFIGAVWGNLGRVKQDKLPQASSDDVFRTQRGSQTPQISISEIDKCAAINGNVVVGLCIPS